MNRRSFFTNWLARPETPVAADPLSRPAASGLDPYIPDASRPWNALRAGHLLRRATFMPRWEDISTLVALSPSQAVDMLLNTASPASVPSMADHVTESLEGLDVTYRGIIKGEWEADATTLRTWYADVMRNAGLTIAEKMTAFWSNHFATEFVVDEDYVQAPLLYRQNKLFRENGLKNFKDLVMSVTLDGAMLVAVYRDGHRVSTLAKLC